MSNALLLIHMQQPNNKKLYCNFLLGLLWYSHRHNEKVGVCVIAIASLVMYHILCQKEQKFQGCREWCFVRV